MTVFRKTPAVSLVAVSAVLLLAGCASVPSGPSVMALPGSGKHFDQFRGDDAICREYARQQIGGASANQAGVDAGLRSAAVGTAVGAVAGAAIGGRNAVGVGAGTGLLVGSLAGTSAAQGSAYGAQHNYDNAYVQCMYGNGHQVPVAAGLRSQSRAQDGAAYPPAPPAARYPPPNAGAPPR